MITQDYFTNLTISLGQQLKMPEAIDISCISLSVAGRNTVFDIASTSFELVNKKTVITCVIETNFDIDVFGPEDSTSLTIEDLIDDKLKAVVFIDINDEFIKGPLNVENIELSAKKNNTFKPIKVDWK